VSKADKDHFDNYRTQNAVKHTIVEKYLKPYFDILAKAHSRINYIDGFAGPGHYESTILGSPLRAMKLVGDHARWHDIVRLFFVEPRSDHFSDLDAAVQELRKETGDTVKPLLRQGKFADHIGSLVGQLDKEFKTLAPSFLFVDPCGVEGVDFRVICDILRRDGCEVFIFFNASGVHRILAAKQDGGSSATLESLLGSKDRVDELDRRMATREPDLPPEDLLVEFYSDLLRQCCKAEYVIPFRIEREERRATSHYLIHASKNAVGFRIMKDVMFSVGTADDEGIGSLELRQAGAADISVLFRDDVVAARDEILKWLQKAPTQVSTFTVDFAGRSHDMFAPKAYRQLLLKLEASGDIVVYDKANASPAPSPPRRRGTLAPDYWLRLPT
jgi:three-Cys-motif partner protein